MDEGYTRKLAISLDIPLEAAAVLVAAGHDTPRKVKELGDEELRALVGEETAAACTRRGATQQE